MNVCKQTFYISRMRLSQKVKDVYLHMIKIEIKGDFTLGGISALTTLYITKLTKFFYLRY